MIRPSWKYLILGGILAVGLSLGASQAEAHWWGRPHLFGCWPRACWAPRWTICCDPCCDVGWYRAWGPVYRFGLFRRRVVVSSWAYGDPCCNPCCVAEGYGAPTLTSEEPMPTEAAPKLPPKPTPAELPGPAAQPSSKPPAGKTNVMDKEIEALLKGAGPATPAAPPNATPPANPPLPGGTMVPRTSGMLLTLHVPANAKVLINGRATQCTGTERHYVSYGLKDGKVYPYAVTVLVPRKSAITLGEGSPGENEIQVSRTLYVKAGDDRQLVFSDDLRLERQLADATGLR